MDNFDQTWLKNPLVKGIQDFQMRKTRLLSKGGSEIFQIHRQRIKPSFSGIYSINQFQPKASFGAWGSHVSTLSWESGVFLREAKAAQECRSSSRWSSCQVPKRIASQG